MKKNLFILHLVFYALSVCVNHSLAQHTFSIVAVDPVTQEVGSAGASFVPDCSHSTINDVFSVHPGVGAIHTQAYYNEENQSLADWLMDYSYSPQDIIDYVVLWDAENNPAVRQYIIIDLVNGGRSAGYTGDDCPDYANHLLGKNYAIAGNILYGVDVLDRMQSGFLNTPGTLAEKLMGALQGGKQAGGDKRGEQWGLSSLFAALKVAKPVNAKDSLYLDLFVSYGGTGWSSLIDPVDSLHILYHRWKKVPVHVSIPRLDSHPGEIILVPVNMSLPNYISSTSAELTISGYEKRLNFIDLVMDSSLTGAAGWHCQASETDSSLLITAHAGAHSIRGEGVFAWLKFSIPDTASGFVPIIVECVVVNQDTAIPVELTSGGITIQSRSKYGDVSLDGEIRADDALLILNYLVEDMEFKDQQMLNANVTLDSTISALDASLILQNIAGILESLPYDTTMMSLHANGELFMENADILPGEIEVPIYLSNGDNILSFECEVTYDSTLLTFSNMSWSDELTEFSIKMRSKEGKLTIAGAGTTPASQGHVFAALQFKTANVLADETTVSLDKLRWNEENVLTNVASAVLTKTTDIRAENTLPKEFFLNQNFPNPFNQSTTIVYQLAARCDVDVSIYNTSGQLIACLVNGNEPPGVHSVTWEPGELSSGVYFCKMMAGEFVATKKMLAIK